MKQVYEFKDGGKEMVALLGGKGANLAEMAKIDLPIPKGIIISTTACNDYFKNDKKLSFVLEEEILRNIRVLEYETGKKFQSAKPLLVSVRSGAPVSMPGMMDTILNLGFNDYVAEKMLEITKDEKFVYTSYLRFVQMFSEIAKGINRKKFMHLKATDYKAQIIESKNIYREECGEMFPENYKAQILIAVKSIFDSWNNDRAILYRKLHNIDNNMGTAVVIQEMVFGNFNDKSGTGVLFTRNPSTGEDKIFGEVLLNAQGEDIVAGIRTPDNIEVLKIFMPNIYNELVDTVKRLEKHNRDMQDVEFTIEDSKLYILQTRNGKRTAEASLKIAMDLVNEGIITKEEAILKVEPASINKLLNGDFEEKYLKEATLLTKGLAASSGVAVGRIMFDAKRVKIREKTILVREETSPEDLQGMALAQGIITLKGGATSHGAVVARGMGKCCVTGCSEIKIDEINKTMTVGKYTLKEGDFISVSGHTGEIYLGKIPLKENSFSDELKEFVSWASKIKRMGVRMNADTPEDVEQGKAFGAQGIGLCRTEHMFFKKDKIWTIREFILSDRGEEKEKALEKLHNLQKEDFLNIFKILDGDEANIRLLDPPVHEFLPKTLEDKKKMAEILSISLEDIEKRIYRLKDENPMLGHRGCRLGVSYPELYRIQARAIVEAAYECEKKGLKVHPEIMIPFIMESKELAYLRKEIEEEIESFFKEVGATVKYKLGTMIEIPRACLLANEIAEYADFFSFGTNDLTQMSMGLSRDDSVKFLDDYREKGIWEGEPFYSIDTKAVTKLVKIGVKNGRTAKPNLQIGVCGEHGGDPKSIEFFEEQKFDYVSCSPFRVPTAILAAAQSYLKLKN
ncbi:Pyruvate%2C phosphate dikinase [Fusobacterium polymorphum]|uniref:Pyruvate, phosphate dikinase n=1 Tax=Fusobacterium polymorphum ATCC 10953 TaxID=393480 RepID=A5TWI6_FUSNP|nr:pyruvate, phosphate dikinase [Fusobacterium polymorphum]EDK89261.1 pyruvate, phosphate dikinase [Fusobacterium polymorphum ATCC 10953]WRL68921.1 pyruvate, phosphate dikinase [Fusobacterium polymorphum]CKG97902.1 Pyruvate%2C phosphate dikinase [Fusobacterium polymorphum]